MAELPARTPLECARPDAPVQLGPNDAGLAPLFEVVAPSGHTFRIWPNGRAEGFPEGSVLTNSLAPRLAHTLGMVARLRNGGRFNTCVAEQILDAWDDRAGGPSARSVERGRTWGDIVNAFVAAAPVSRPVGRPDAPVQFGPNDAALALDRTVAEVVFGIPAETLESWPFELPRFSTDRHAAGVALTRVHALTEGPARVQKALADELDQWLPSGDRSHFAVLTVLTAAAICRAAISAARECAAVSAAPAPNVPFPPSP